MDEATEHPHRLLRGDEICKRAKINYQTLGNYVRAGLIPKGTVKYEKKGRRFYYPEEIIETVQIIKELQSKGSAYRRKGGLDGIRKLLESGRFTADAEEKGAPRILYQLTDWYPKEELAFAAHQLEKADIPYRWEQQDGLAALFICVRWDEESLIPEKGGT